MKNKTKIIEKDSKIAIANKNMFMGLLLIVIGSIWWMSELGFFEKQFLWPIVLVTIGAFILIKGVYTSSYF